MSRYRAILSDLDGTVNRGNMLIEGVRAAYEDLSKKGIRWLFLSNNAATLAPDIARSIVRLGIRVQEDQVLNSASALIHTVKRDYRGARVLVVGEAKLVQGLEDAGAIIEQDPMVTDIVVTALDTTFSYEKLKRAHVALQHGALFWATNLDSTYPVPDGFLPGAGSIAASVACAAGRPPDRVFGKPSPDMAFLALELLHLPANECLVVGDRMETDVLFARNATMASALVLTGATSRSDLRNFGYHPDHVIPSIADLPDLFAQLEDH
ncbi:MAG: HAD-IIA family hydrolase [Desulfomonile tiedjei]|nr:HAD-IIA family hydrolase [Desulfomonile tiedjei]